MTNKIDMNKIELEKSVNHHIALSAIMIKRVFYKILSNHELNITPEQWIVLNHLSETDALTIGELSELTLKDFANTSRMTQKLVKAGYVQKKRDAVDKRIFMLVITKPGKELIKELHQCAYESTNIAMNGIDEKTQKIILKNLKEVISNTTKYLK